MKKRLAKKVSRAAVKSRAQAPVAAGQGLDHHSLRAWMDRLGVDEAWIAEKAMVSAHTVTAWLRPPTSKAHRNISRPAQRLLLIELKQAESQGDTDRG